MPLGFDPNLAKTIFLLLRRPLRRPVKGLDELLGDRFA